MKKEEITMPYTIKREFGTQDTIRIGGWGKFGEARRILTEAEAAVLVGILMNFLNKEDVK